MDLPLSFLFSVESSCCSRSCGDILFCLWPFLWVCSGEVISRGVCSPEALGPPFSLAGEWFILPLHFLWGVWGTRLWSGICSDRGPSTRLWWCSSLLLLDLSSECEVWSISKLIKLTGLSGAEDVCRGFLPGTCSRSKFLIELFLLRLSPLLTVSRLVCIGSSSWFDMFSWSNSASIRLTLSCDRWLRRPFRLLLLLRLRRGVDVFDLWLFSDGLCKYGVKL